MKLKRWTARIAWGDVVEEEIDVEAADKLEARRKVARLLAEGYEPDARIVDIIERSGLYF